MSDEMIFRIEKKSAAEPAYARFCRSDARANYYIFSEEDPINIWSFTLGELLQLKEEIQRVLTDLDRESFEAVWNSTNLKGEICKNK